ncbi:MAG: hypothetical protein K2Y20_12980 [Sphingomonas sp.]|nr:hypothetical protein [Sphingomonas sp.]
MSANIASSQGIVEDAARGRQIGGPAPAHEDTIEMAPFELRILEGKAAHLILKGDCSGAMKLVLEAGDLDGAAKVAAVCRSK